MSTIQGLSIEAQDEARRRAMDEVYRRQQERMELNRELVETLRSMKTVQREQMDLQADLDALHAQLAEVESAWAALEEARSAAREAASSEGKVTEEDVAETLRAGLRVADQIEAGLRTAARRLGYLTAAGTEIDALKDKLGRTAQLGTELTFMLRDTRLLAPTVLTLVTMQNNGYTLRETLSKDGLVGYFVSADRTHQVAVRHRPAPSATPSLQRALHEEAAYQLEVETFQMEGEACLDVLEDFVLGLEEKGLRNVAWAEPRRYPKDDGDTGIPVPVAVKPAVAEPGAIPEGPERA